MFALSSEAKSGVKVQLVKGQYICVIISGKKNTT